MKKLFTLLFLFAFVFTTNAAVQLRENFESGSLPAGWTIYSTVTATQAWRVAESVSNGVGGTPKSISAYEWTPGTHYFAGIPYLAQGKNYNEWLVSPEVNNSHEHFDRLVSQIVNFTAITDQRERFIVENGTLALELGFYALGLSGAEVVTTPFTFVAHVQTR